MRKTPTILLALLACSITVTPIMMHAAPPLRRPHWRGRPAGATGRRPVRRRQIALKKAQKGGKSEEVTAAQKALTAAQKALTDAQKQKQKQKSANS